MDSLVFPFRNSFCYMRVKIIERIHIKNFAMTTVYDFKYLSNPAFFEMLGQVIHLHKS
jgi:hypothetical protein